MGAGGASGATADAEPPISAAHAVCAASAALTTPMGLLQSFMNCIRIKLSRNLRQFGSRASGMN